MNRSNTNDSIILPSIPIRMASLEGAVLEERRQDDGSYTVFVSQSNSSTEPIRPVSVCHALSGPHLDGAAVQQRQ